MCLLRLFTLLYSCVSVQREEEDADDVNIFSSYGKESAKREEDEVDPDDINAFSSYGGKATSKREEESTEDADDVNIFSSYGKSAENA